MSRLLNLATLTATTLLTMPVPWSQQTNTNPTATPTPTEIAAFVGDYADANMDGAGVPGMVFIQVDGAEIVTAAAYGMADMEQERPMTVDTPLRVGSLSKPITAALAFELAAEGAVDLDVPVDRYLDVDLSDSHGPASTLRQLVNHRGGYPDAIVGSHHVTDGSATTLADWVTTVPPRAVAPDVVPTYSSVGYTVAGAALAGAMGQGFDTVAEEYLFRRLGMVDATFAQPPPASVAVGYRGVSGALAAVPVDRADLVPGAGLTATANDMGRFMASLLDAGGLHRSTREALLTISADEPQQRGLTAGLAEWRYEHRSVLYHEGNGIGTSNRIMLLPTEGIGFFTSVNGAALTGMSDPSLQNRFIRDLHSQIIEHFYPESSGAHRISSVNSGQPTDEVDGVYIPTRVDPDSILRLEALVAQHDVAATETGVEWNGSAYEAVHQGVDGVYRNGDRTLVFLQGRDGVTYANSGGTGSYREAELWETVRFNIIAVGGSLALVLATLAVGFAATSGPLRSTMIATGSSIVAFLVVLGYALGTVEAMDLFTGLTVPIHVAQAAAAAIVISTVALAVTIGLTHRNGLIRVRTLTCSVGMLLAGVSMSAWAWYWNVLPI